MPAIKTVTPLVVALFLATLAACSGSGTFNPSGSLGGGSSPLGPSSGSTTIIGSTNSLTASTSSLQPMDTASTGVQICVDGATACTSVDGRGRFTLEGDFSGDVALLVVGPKGPIVQFTILGVVEGETIVVRVELDDDRSRIEILSRSHDNSDTPSDDVSSDEASGDDAPSDDDTSDTISDDVSDDTSDDDVSDDRSDDASDDSSDDASNDDDASPSPV